MRFSLLLFITFFSFIFTCSLDARPKCFGVVLAPNSKMIKKSKDRCKVQSYQTWQQTVRHFRKNYPGPNFPWIRVADEKGLKIIRINPMKNTKLKFSWQGITLVFKGKNTKYFIYKKESEK